MRAASSPASARLVRDHRVRRLRRVDARRVALTRATDDADDDARASTSSSILPADAEDGLRRYRAVLAPLFLAGGFLHVPDLFGVGPIAGAFDASSLGELSPGARALTALWAVGGPAAAAGLAMGSFVGDVAVTCVASAEIIVGIDFPGAIAPAEIPGPIVAAQMVNLASLVGLRAWQTAEKRRGETRARAAGTESNR
jgi:hypothetical protein